jgi:transposase InsO family protein
VRSWGLSVQEQEELWQRWRQGESLRLIARRWASAAYAELVYGHGVIVNPKTVRRSMRLHGLGGLPRLSKRFHRKANIATTADLVQRRFDRPAPDQLWVTDITEHPTREGKVYCCVVLDVFSRRVVGWSIDSHQATPPVTNALGMAIHNHRPRPEQTVIHSDRGSQPRFKRVHPTRQGLRAVALDGHHRDAYDNAVIDSFWARMQTELLDRRRWITRIELANAIFEHLEIFHSRQRRHSALGWRTPGDFEKLHATDVA